MAPPAEREQPYVSVDSLAEYLEAKAVRRRSLIRKWKFPRGSPPRWHVGSRPAIAAALATGSTAALEDKLVEMLADNIGEDCHEWQRAACITAVAEFVDEEILDLLPDYSGFELEAFGVATERTKLTIAGVTVSVAPEVTARTADKSLVGLIKVHLNQTNPLTEYAGSCAATLLELFAKKVHGGEGTPSPPHLTVVDVFQGRVFCAPRSLKRRRATIQAACEEIAARWPTVRRRASRR